MTMSECVTTQKTTQQETAKWLADRERWLHELPIMGYLSQFLTVTPVVDSALNSASTDGKSLFFAPNTALRYLIPPASSCRRISFGIAWPDI
jgi:hypothetical protein